ncbi:MAG: DUF885 family protein [Steroidobacteraceae bacterium]
MRARLTIFCVLTVLPVLRATAAGDAALEKLIAEESAIERQTDPKDGPACRLEMDVGIHWKGWTKEQAESCLRDNTALPQSSVVRETQRYIAWPAQALAYKIGELQFLAERQRAEQALGTKFDIRAFHDAVLDDGPMPLSILHEHIGRWIEATERKHRRVASGS